jgi:peptidoglycan/LPS O-acetylase OafA/YrhL
MVWVGARYDVPARWRKACTVLGDISYPIYAVHFPIILFAVFMARRAGIHDAVTIPVVIAGLTGLCYWLGAYVDPGLREALRRALTFPNRRRSGFEA